MRCFIAIDLDKKVKKDYKKVMYGSINSMALISDKKYLYVADFDGFMKQIDTKEKKVVKDYKKIHNWEISAIVISANGESLFTSSWDGQLKQWSIAKREMHKDFGNVMDEIWSLTVTLNNTWLFVGGHGRLLQIAISDGNIVKDYEGIMNNFIYSMVTTRDSKS